MHVEVVSASDASVRFVLSGVNVAFANALRRIMIAEVPCMAIEAVSYTHLTLPTKA